MRNLERRYEIALIAAWPILVIALCALRAAQAADTASAAGTPSSSAAASVYTRATVRSIFEEDGGKRLYIRLKLVPRGKIPFSTLTFRVLDRTLVIGLSEGASIGFVAERINGENTLTAVRVMPRCERFQKCN